MPAQKGQSSLLAKHGAKFVAAIPEAANAETTYGRAEMPGNVKNGIARLTAITFGEFQSGKNKDQLYCRLEGSALYPPFVLDENKVPQRVAGNYTMIIVPLCDTVDSKGKAIGWKEHLNELFNHFRMLGGEDFTKGATTLQHVEGLAKALEQAKPPFRFETSQSPPTQEFPNPMIFHRWLGNKDLEETDLDALVAGEEQDDTSPVMTPPKTNGAAPKAAAPIPPKGGTGVAPAKPAMSGPRPGSNRTPPKPAPAPKAEEKPFDETMGDLESLAAAADEAIKAGEEPSEELTDSLSDRATAAGMTEQEITNATSWTALVEQIRAREAGGAEAQGDESEAGGEEQEWVPEPEFVCTYSPIDPKTKKPVKTPVEVEIVAVDKTKKTATLKNLQTGKMITGPDGKAAKVEWSKLIQG